MGHISGTKVTVKKYAVAYVSDTALRDADWAFITYRDTLVFAIREHAVSAEALADAWGAFRLLEALAAA